MTSRSRVLCTAVFAAAVGCGVVAALHYYRLGLTLSHYDARGHLVVARRIIDSITPGWRQIGAVWLPLPHLLNALPVQIDLFYRTGASAVAVSILAFGLTAASVAYIVLRLSGSRWAASCAATLVALNPNLLYLQSTPMTEPLLLGLTTLGVALLIRWATHTSSPDADKEEHSIAVVGVVFALACLTRYESWPIVATALCLAAGARWRAGEGWREACRRAAQIGLYPAAAIIGFMVFSRIVIGEWFVASGFFVPENPALNHPIEAASQLVWGAHTLNGTVLGLAAILGVAWLVVEGVRSRSNTFHLIALSLMAGEALPWLAFVQGHPYRIRYVVPLIAMEAVGAGFVLTPLVRRCTPLAAVAALALVGAVVVERPPLDRTAAMVVEAQWDLPNVVARREVTNCLRAGYANDTIMASMGSLGHYMQETSEAGFALRDFLHEGNGDIWLKALEGPRPFVGWILIEEKAEGGDMLATRVRENPRFLDGFSRVCEAAGLALYQRQNRMLNVAR